MAGTKKEWALSYAAMGWPVFPCQVDGKAPATAHGLKDATTDTAQIESWWNTNPDFNIGHSTGSGTVWIDLDKNHQDGVDGEKTLAEWEAVHGSLPQTVESQTAKGGKHRPYQVDGQFRNRTGLYPGIDVRGDGGYVILPPSVVGGKEYKWVKPPSITEIAEADTAVYNFLSPVPKGFDAFSPPYVAPDSLEEGNRTNGLLRMLGSLQAKGLTDEAIRAAIVAENDNRCNPPLSDNELEREVFPALRRFPKGTAPYTHDRDYDLDVAEIVEALRELHPEINKRYGWNDAGNGNLFSDLTGGRVCFVPERKKWYFYDGMRWKPDTGGAHTMNLCKTVANALIRYVTETITDEKLRADYLKHVSKWQGFKYRETILKDAATVSTVGIGEFDCDPLLLNCQNGTLNLKTGVFQDYNSSDLITKLANVEYRPGTRCTRWETFVDEITCGDAELAQYIQKSLGYALTGDTRYECFFILYGATSRNGKGTLCETFMKLIGDYGRTASPESIAQRKYSDSRSPSEDIARLAGARFVNMSEPDKRMVFSAALVKTLTGNDTVAARFLGENSFEFKPRFKLFINTNHLPYATDATLFSSDRVEGAGHTAKTATDHAGKPQRDSELVH